MKKEIAISRAAWNAAFLILQEFVHQGGVLRGVKMKHAEEAMNALAWADRIEIKAKGK
jgi:hypothetical protein